MGGKGKKTEKSLFSNKQSNYKNENIKLELGIWLCFWCNEECTCLDMEDDVQSYYGVVVNDLIECFSQITFGNQHQSMGQTLKFLVFSLVCFPPLL